MSGEAFDGVREPALAALLNALVDRIDTKPFAERSRDLLFPLSHESWPEFFAIDHPGERAIVWQWVETLASRPGLALKLDERKSRRDLDIWERQPRLVVTPEAEGLLREVTGRHPRICPGRSDGVTRLSAVSARANLRFDCSRARSIFLNDRPKRSWIVLPASLPLQTRI